MQNLLLILATVLSATRVAGRLSSQEGKNDIYDTTGGKGEAIEYEYLAPVIEGVNMTDVVVAQEYAKVHFIDQRKGAGRSLQSTVRKYRISCDCSTTGGVLASSINSACPGHTYSTALCSPWSHVGSREVLVAYGSSTRVSCYCHTGDDSRERRVTLTALFSGMSIGSIEAIGNHPQFGVLGTINWGSV